MGISDGVNGRAMCQAVQKHWQNFWWIQFGMICKTLPIITSKISSTRGNTIQLIAPNDHPKQLISLKSAQIVKPTGHVR